MHVEWLLELSIIRIRLHFICHTTSKDIMRASGEPSSNWQSYLLLPVVFYAIF